MAASRRRHRMTTTFRVYPMSGHGEGPRGLTNNWPTSTISVMPAPLIPAWTNRTVTTKQPRTQLVQQGLKVIPLLRRQPMTLQKEEREYNNSASSCGMKPLITKGVDPTAPTGAGEPSEWEAEFCCTSASVRGLDWQLRSRHVW